MYQLYGLKALFFAYLSVYYKIKSTVIYQLNSKQQKLKQLEQKLIINLHL